MSDFANEDSGGTPAYISLVTTTFPVIAAFPTAAVTITNALGGSGAFAFPFTIAGRMVVQFGFGGGSAQDIGVYTVTGTQLGHTGNVAAGKHALSCTLEPGTYMCVIDISGTATGVNIQFATAANASVLGVFNVTGGANPLPASLSWSGLISTTSPIPDYGIVGLSY